MPIILFLVILVLGLAVLAGAAAILAGLLLAFMAAPSFWGAFWLILAAILVFRGSFAVTGKRD
ncbi:membrane protein [Microbacterium phage Katzastrophic]|uniref:membrane protein n=1 Tax=Microbacterium phage Katzastrophic TaxID=2912654 RepID=UPI00242C2F62|nr:membrane protein [Microbacterium phage Katzastrophic]UKH48496.1 membrane protein [Microbacterium phage Katzastrophic]